MQIPACIDITQHRKKLKVPEIRVWVHPKNGDDYYHVFDTFKDALGFIKTTAGAEDVPLLAYKGYEINIFEIKKVKRND